MYSILEDIQNVLLFSLETHSRCLHLYSQEVFPHTEPKPLHASV